MMTAVSSVSPELPRRDAVLLDGARLRDEVLVEVRRQLAAAGTPPVCLATVVADDDPASHRAAAYKHDAATRAGLRSRAVALPGTAGHEQVADAIGTLATDHGVHGIFVHLPLPPAVDADRVMDLLPRAKDIDGLGAANLARLLRGAPGHRPCTPVAVLRVLSRYGVDIAGRHAVVIGHSPRIGLPMALLLARAGVTVTLAEPDATDLAARCREADLVVTAADRPGLVTADWIREGAAVVDAGTGRRDGQLAGDVDFASVRARAGAVTPNPGGIGPATVACLVEATVMAARMLDVLP